MGDLDASDINSAKMDAKLSIVIEIAFGNIVD